MGIREVCLEEVGWYYGLHDNAKDVDDECAHGHEREHQAEVVTTTADEEASGSTTMMVTMRTFCRKIPA